MWLEEQLLLGGGSALNRGPQLGFHNDISRGQAESSALQMGKLRRRLLQSLRREGLSSAIQVHSSSSAGPCCPRVVTGCMGWPLFPAWRERRGQTREENRQGGQEDLEAGPKGTADGLATPRRLRHRGGPLAAVQRGYEEDAVLVLKLVVQLPQQFPVGIVNQHQNPWPHAVSLDEQLWPLFEQVLLDPDKEVPDVPGFVLSGQGDLMFLHAVKQELRTASEQIGRAHV